MFYTTDENHRDEEVRCLTFTAEAVCKEGQAFAFSPSLNDSFHISRRISEEENAALSYRLNVDFQEPTSDRPAVKKEKNFYAIIKQRSKKKAPFRRYAFTE